MFLQDQVERVPFLDGSFSPSEAQEIINSLVKQYRDFYNLQFMKNWEGNHEFDSSEIDKKIKSLELLQKELNALIQQARQNGTRLDVEGLLKVNLGLRRQASA